LVASIIRRKIKPSSCPIKPKPPWQIESTASNSSSNGIVRASQSNSATRPARSASFALSRAIARKPSETSIPVIESPACASAIK
jgi:hypothetical protein